MIKKILIGIFVITGIFNNVSVYSDTPNVNIQLKPDVSVSPINFDGVEAPKGSQAGDIGPESSPNRFYIDENGVQRLEIVGERTSDSNNTAKNSTCEGENCINSANFKIGVNKTLGGIGIQVTDGNSTQTINRTLGTIVQKLMIALGVLSVLIMTVGGGYIILYHGQDELLSKGKAIFMSGITSLAVALSSYYIIAILRYILYN